MTVCNRSNDVIWGAYGANVVQFSMLQEYIAAKLGLPVGVYRQVSDSFHAYIGNPLWEKLRELPLTSYDPYKYDVSPYPLMSNSEMWDEDLIMFMNESVYDRGFTASVYVNPFFKDVAIPMFNVWFRHKKDNDGLEFVSDIKAMDWRTAAQQWLLKREGNDNELR